MSSVDAYEHCPNCPCSQCGDPRSMDLLDKYLTVWIFGTMAVGMGSGYSTLSEIEPTQNLHLVGMGLILMMYPPLAKADYLQLVTVFSN